MNCETCHERLQQLLDGEAVADRADLGRHLAACPGCRELHAAARRLQDGLRRLALPAPPPGLSTRIVADVFRDRQQRLRRWTVAYAAAAAGLLAALVGGYAWLRPGPRTDPPPIVRQSPPPAPPAAPSLRDSVAEAGEAVLSLTRRTADDAVVQTRSLLAVPVAPPEFDENDMLQEALDPPARSLREAGQGVSAGLQPVTDSARRALSLFLRDLPSAPPDGTRGL